MTAFIIASSVVTVWIVYCIARRKWVRGTGFAIAMAGLIVLLSYGDVEVESIASSDTDHPGIVYLVHTTPDYLQRLRTLWNNKPIHLVCSKGTEATVALHYPEAVVETLEYRVDGVDVGPTIQAALRHLNGRLNELRGAGNDAKVFFFIPVTDNISRDRADVARMVGENPWLADRLTTLFPGEGQLKSWPLPGATEIAGPRQVAEGSTEYRAQVNISVPPGHQYLYELAYYFDGVVKYVTFDSAGKQTWETDPSAARHLINTDLDITLTLTAPKPGAAHCLISRLYSPSGHAVSQAVLVTRSEAPEVAALLPIGMSEDDSDVTKLMTSLNLPVRAVHLNLNDVGAIDDNATALSNWGMILVDVPLTEAQGQVLSASLIRCGKNHGKAPTPVFVGLARGDSVRDGWKPFLPTAEPFTVARRVAVVFDWSGSMRWPIYGKRKADIVLDSISRLAEGLAQRNRATLVMIIGPDGKEIQGSPSEALERIRAMDLDPGFWEMGPQLETLQKLAGSSHLSDVIMFVDNADTRGPYHGDGDGLRAEDEAAGNKLMDDGVRLHVVSIGGELSGKIGLKGRLTSTLNFEGHANLDELNAKLQQKVLDVALPRLNVSGEPRGWASLPQSNQKRFERLFDGNATVPGVELLVPLGGFRARADVTDSANVLLYVNHWKEDLVSPFFYRCHGRGLTHDGTTFTAADNIVTYHLALDITSEAAKLPTGLSKRAPALADLLVSSLSAVATAGFKRPKLLWEVNDRSEVVAAGRDGRIFTIAPDGLPHDPLCILHTEDLSRIRWEFRDLTATAKMKEVVLKDEDPTISTQRIRVPLVGSPPLPLRSASERGAIGKPLYDVPPDPAVAPVDQPRRFSQNDYRLLLIGVCLVTMFILGRM